MAALPQVAPERIFKIILLIDYFLPHAGGSRNYYYSLYKSLVRQFPDQVTILTKKVPGWKAFDQQESTKNLRIIRRGRPLATWKYHQLPRAIFPFAHALRLVRKNRIDLIHSGDLYPPGVISFWLKRLFGIPYLAYCHGEEVTQTDRYRYQPNVRNHIYLSADALVAASEFARQNLLRIGIPENRIHKITPGVDFERFCPRPACPTLVQQLGLQGKTVLLTVARLIPRKGHRFVLRALAAIHRDVPGLRYLIVGEGSEEKNLRGLVAELGLGEAVGFVGVAPQEQLPDLYNLCDLFVMTNWEEADGDTEGFGMVFLEANASGKPVVGGQSGGTAEAIREGVTGFRVNPQNTEELAGTLKRLVLNPGLRRQMGSLGLQWVRAAFNWESRARQLREISREIIRQTAASSLRNLGGGSEETLRLRSSEGSDFWSSP